MYMCMNDERIMYQTQKGKSVTSSEVYWVRYSGPHHILSSTMKWKTFHRDVLILGVGERSQGKGKVS